MDLSVRQMHPFFVGEVSGVDTGRPLEGMMVRALAEAIDRYAVLVFRGQDLDDERQMPLPDGRLLLRELIEHATRREFVYRHEWREGDLLIWDNRCTMHRGRAFDEQEMRDLRRVTTRDTASTLDQVA